ncbi:calcium-binding protein [Rhodobacteraceae bacterium LMO-12]|nr:calcium-binding protein [Rhodobacteraceae bacterium LMO-JJ12]
MLRVFCLVLWGILLAQAPVQADERKVYFFGNSLIHHLSDTDETTVPHWLARMAQAAGHRFGADGQWGFLRDFARPGKPLANWSFREVPGVWDRDRTDFAAAGWEAIVINPANFIQYQAPDAPYDGDNPDGASPLSALERIIDAHGVAPIYLYEGWAEMSAGFPPSARQFRRYNAFNRGEYHDWYVAFTGAAQQARPEAQIRLIPVASILSELFSDGPLAGIDPEALYVDADPHGTPTLYLLAGMVTYSVLYGEPAPTFDLPDNIAPELRQSYPQVARTIYEKLGEQDSAAAPQPPTTPVVTPTATSEPDPTRPSGVAVGVADPSLAMGLNGIADWTTQQPFINIMKTGRPWLGHEGERWGAWDAERLASEGYLDKDGWPLRLPPGVDRIESFILTDQDEGAQAMAGRYRVRWKGEGRLRIGGRLRNLRLVDGANEAWFDYTPGPGEVALTIQQTDPRGVGEPIREIEVVREDQIVLHELGLVFNPDWTARIADLRVLRFMDWMLTNGSPVTSWEGRPRWGDFSYAWRGVPVEVMIELANLVGADPWFCMPHGADDAYSEHFAEMVLARLDPRLNTYVEYSNEVWNYGFPQAGWLAEQARARWGSKAGDDAWMQFAGMRAAQVMRAWGGVFAGEDAARLVRVVAVHTGWLGLEEPLLDAPLWLAEAGSAGLSPAAHFDAYAVSGYFGFELGDGEEGRLADTRRWIDESRAAAEQSAKAQGLQRRALEAAIAPSRFDLAIPKAAQAIRDGSLNELMNTLWPYHAKVAKRHGLALIMYEGGSHVVGHGGASNDEALTDFFRAFSYSEDMAALYREELAGWRSVGGQLFNAFVDVARPTQFGSWGALRHLQDDNSRWRALMGDNAIAPKPDMGRVPGTFLHGVMRRAGPAGEVLHGTAEEDILLGGDGDDRLISYGGSDFLDGGQGDDVALLPGTRAQYSFAMQDGRLLATRGAAEIRLRRIERLGFEAEPDKIYRLELPE